MPADGRVSLTTQTIFCIIPVLDMYAAYRIKKLRMYLLIMIVFVAIPMTIVDIVAFPSEEDKTLDDLAREMVFQYDDPVRMLYSIATWVVTVLIAIFLIRRWSVQWNSRF